MKLSYSNSIDVLEQSYCDAYKNYLSKSLERMYGFNSSKDTLIKNKSNLISNAEFEKILDLLHPDYKKLGATINIHGNKFHTLLEWLRVTNNSERRKMLLEGAKKEIGGFQNNSEIMIFSYLYKSKVRKLKNGLGCFKLLVISAFLHEIRHMYQMRYMNKKYKDAVEKYISSGNKGYENQWVERDANAFTQRMMNNNKKKINEILGIEFDWNCIWGSFQVEEGNR